MTRRPYRRLSFATLQPFLVQRLVTETKSEFCRDAANDKRIAAFLGVNRRTVARWRREDEVPVRNADRAALLLGLHPAVIWGRAEWDAANDCVEGDELALLEAECA